MSQGTPSSSSAIALGEPPGMVGELIWIRAYVIREPSMLKDRR